MGPGGGMSQQEHLRLRHERIETLRASMSGFFDAGFNPGPWVLEVGCGHGHFLTDYARQHPPLQCLGVDFCRDRIRRAERKLQRARLANLRFLHGEAGEFFEALPPDLRFQQIFALFPDPWPKRRHRKHRLVSADFLEQIAHRSVPGAEFFFRSDALEYVQEVKSHLAGQSRWRTTSRSSLPVETTTVFQQRAVRYDTVVAVLVN